MGSYDVGGLVRRNYGTVSGCYSTGSVLGGGGGGYVGGLVGYNDDGGTVSSSYWDVEASGQSSSAGGVGKTTAEMKQEATYTGWDFANVWDIVEGQSYPYLRALESTQESEGEGVVEGTPEGEGVVEGIIEGQIEGVMEGAVEGEGLREGEGSVGGIREGEGSVEGMKEGEGEGGTQPSPIEILCGCNRSKSDSGGLKNLLDFILIGAMLLILNSAIAKRY